MAGDNDLLDMSLFDMNSISDTPEIKPEVEEKIEEEVTIPEKVSESIDTKDQADGENQETVGSQEEESVEKSSEETSEETTESPANSDDEVYKVMGAYLKEQGILPSLDTDLSSIEDFAKAVSAEIKVNEFAKLNEDQKAYLTAMSKGVPDELFKTHLANNQIYSGLTDAVLEEREDVRKEVIVQDLLAQGWTPERAERQYQRVFDLGESVEESKISRNNLKDRDKANYEQEIQKVEKAKVAAKTAETEKLENLKKSVYDQSNVFDSFKVNDALKDRVHNSMTKVIGYTEGGIPLNALMKERLDNPVDFETKLYYLYELTNGFKDIKKFSMKADTTAAKKVKEAVSQSSLFKTNSEANFVQREELEGGSPIIDID